MNTVDSMRVTVIDDNVVYYRDLLAQVGFCLLVEVIQGNRETSLLIDTGFNSESTFYNLDALGVDLSRLSGIVLSHGHDDHTNSICEIIGQAQKSIQVYAHPAAFAQKYCLEENGSLEYCGIPENQCIECIVRAGGQFVPITRFQEIGQGIYLTGTIERTNDFELPADNFFVIEGERRRRDMFIDEQALVVNVRDKGLVVVVGCCHVGPIHTMSYVLKRLGQHRIYGLMGGFHLFQYKDKEKLRRYLTRFAGFNLDMIVPCHCTGYLATKMISDMMEDEFQLSYCGRVIEI